MMVLLPPEGEEYMSTEELFEYFVNQSPQYREHCSGGTVVSSNGREVRLTISLSTSVSAFLRTFTEDDRVRSDGNRYMTFDSARKRYRVSFPMKVRKPTVIPPDLFSLRITHDAASTQVRMEHTRHEIQVEATDCVEYKAADRAFLPKEQPFPATSRSTFK
jgi:hypothetical protein